MNSLLANQSQIRLRRASVAQLLLQFHKSGLLDSAELWTWEAMDSLPDWCLLSQQERMPLQLTCGALLLGSQLRLWIDRRYIQAAYFFIGERAFSEALKVGEQMELPPAGHVTLFDQSESGQSLFGESQIGKPMIDHPMIDQSTGTPNTEQLRQCVHAGFAKAGLQVLGSSLLSLYPASMVDALVTHFTHSTAATLGESHHKDQPTSHLATDISQRLASESAMMLLNNAVSLLAESEHHAAWLPEQSTQFGIKAVAPDTQSSVALSASMLSAEVRS